MGPGIKRIYKLRKLASRCKVDDASMEKWIVNGGTSRQLLVFHFAFAR